MHVQEFMFALNSSVHDATGFSPAELFLHRKIVGPGEWVDGDTHVTDRKEFIRVHAQVC